MARGNINLVEIIKRLLFDGRTTDINLILKELIQNADDAEAKRLAFGFSEGLVGAQHPLLGGPAFFAVNSGEFKPEHADGVMSLAESPKVDDPSTIGKFGIGLKSVFYFGEVFFFLCRSQDDHGHDEERLADVFNPYNEPRKNIRPDWDGFGPQDRSLMRAALNRLGVFDGFAIWVPLRTTAAIVTGGQKICIDPNTAGDKPLEFARMLGASEILERTQRAIPLLRHVECIEFFTPAGHACITSQCTGRSHYPDVEGHHAFRGDLQLLPGVPYTFEATEQQPPDQVFTDLQEHPLWARSSRADQTGQVADKTRAHASVTFAHKRTGQGRFQLQWAVFLPLGDPMSLDCAGETEFTVTFHGSFFVNADRRTILAWNKAPIDPGSSGALQARWNAEVARRGIFPLMLPTLARFAVTLSGQETDQLTEALASMSTFTDHRADFCREYEWLKLIGLSGCEWHLLDASTPYLELPFNTGLQDWLPGLACLTAQRTVAVQNAPHLKASRAVRWTAADVDILFQELQPEQLNPEQAEQLGKIIDAVLNLDTRPAVRRVLQRLLLLERNVLTQPGSGERYASLLKKVPPEHQFVLPSGLAGEMRRRLAALSTTVLLVPGELVGSNEARAKLSLADAVKLLAELREVKGQNALRARILEYIDPDERLKLLAAIRAMKLVEVSQTEQESAFITPDQAREWVGSGYLFTEGAGQDQRELLRAVRNAFSDHQLVFTSSALLKHLGESRATTLNVAAVLGLLQNEPSLGGIDQRVVLFQLLREELGKDQAFSQAYRYLLHAHAGADAGPLFALDESSSALRNLSVQVYRSKGQQWRLLDQKAAIFLSPQDCLHLKVQRLDQKGLEREIAASARGEPPLPVDAAQFTPSERRELIATLSVTALNVLPIFETVTGEFSALSRQCFLPGNAEFPETLLETVHLIRPDPKLDDRYQELGLRSLTPEALILHLLGGEAPVRHATWILDQLRPTESKWKPGTLRLLQTTAWLPDSDQQSIAPEQVVDLPPLEASLPGLLAPSRDTGRLLVTPAQLQGISGAELETLRRHQLFPEPDKAVDLLGEVLRNDGQRLYAVGNLTLPKSLAAIALDYHTWQNLFGNVQREALPALSLLETLATWKEQPVLTQRLFERLQFPFPESRLTEILNGLAKKLKGQLMARDHLHRAYLTTLLEAGLWPQVSTDLLLPNAAGGWRPAHQLCLGAPGIHLEDQLHSDWRDLFGPEAVLETRVLSKQDIEAEEEATTLGAAQLKALFTRWSDQVESVLIGAFLSVLGGHQTITELAEHFLGKGRDLGLVRKDLVGAWREDRPLPRPIERVIDQVWLVPSLSGELAVTVMSLTGQPMRIRRREGNDLLAGNPQVSLLSGARFDRKVELRLNHLEPSDLTSHQLEQALLEATRSVLASVYGCTPENLDEAWKQLGDTAQFDLELAQDLIVDDGLAYIMYMLRLPTGHALKATFEEWRELKARQKQANRAGHPARDITVQLEKLKKEFQSSLDTADTETTSGLLEGVRRRIEEAKYQPSSVPFEIFQNADDAVLQLWTMRKGQSFSHRGEEELFVVDQDAQGVTFMHWGRAINQYGLGTFQNNQYQLDLNNMLLLAASDKGDEAVSTTGRFGMGFKSSYLLTERPQVVSGRLGFEVIGGIYPRALASESADRIRKQLRIYGEPVRGTAICLQGTTPEAIGEALRDFGAWVPVTLIFAKAVRSVILGDVAYRWQETPLAEQVTCARLSPGHSLLDRALIFRLRRGTIMIPLGPGGPRALDSTVPTLWVTAPTRSHAAAGLLINAMFAVDIGRSEVTSQAEENLELCDDLAGDLESALVGLFQISDGWEATRVKLGLHEDVTSDHFWRGMWALLAEQQTQTPDNFAGQFVRRLLWQTGGARTLALQHRTVPSGLSGEHDCLTSMHEIQFMVSGVLGQADLLQAQVSNEDLPPGTLLHESVWQTLQTLVGDAPKLRRPPARLTLSDAVRRRFGNEPVIQHTDAPGPVPNPEQLTGSDEERETLRQYLNTFRFETASGTFAFARDLLVATQDKEQPDDEALRAAFAPPDRQLHVSSSPEVTALFMACRKELSANTDVLADWAEAAVTDVQQVAVLQYLLSGALNDTLSRKLSSRGDCWLKSLINLPVFALFDARERMELVAKLSLHLQYAAQLKSGGGPEIPGFLPITRSSDPKAELEALYDRWTACRAELIQHFESRRYPAFMREGQLLKPLASDREQWMGLFMIGSFMTLGYIEQGTGNYLTLAHNKGWMTTFSSEELDTDGWFRILDTYTDEEETSYRQWVNRFLAAYQISRYLGDYIRIFQDAHHLCSPTPLWHLLDVKRSPLYTGTGLDIPSIRYALGIGQHFVLRELVRRGLIPHQNLDADCYVPTKKVREALYYYGCDIDPEEWGHETSTKIHQFLVDHLGEEKARFHGDFDLPFVLLS